VDTHMQEEDVPDAFTALTGGVFRGPPLRGEL